MSAIETSWEEKEGNWGYWWKEVDTSLMLEDCMTKFIMNNFITLYFMVIQ